MEANGAAIAPEKCWWYLVDFQWTGGKWTCRDAGENAEIRVRDKNNQTWRLKYLPFDRAKEMVGGHLAPDGNQTEQVKALTKKVTKSRQHFNF